jgi:hypothetical protein
VNNKRRSHGLGELQKRERFVQRGGPHPPCFAYQWETKELRGYGVYQGETKDLGESGEWLVANG